MNLRKDGASFLATLPQFEQNLQLTLLPQLLQNILVILLSLKNVKNQ